MAARTLEDVIAGLSLVWFMATAGRAPMIVPDDQPAAWAAVTAALNEWRATS